MIKCTGLILIENMTGNKISTLPEQLQPVKLKGVQATCG
jgi:hypothetical protein